MTLDTFEDRTVAAGEYVLGTLGEDDTLLFEAALAADAGLRAEVAYWQDRLLALTRQCPPADRLPAEVWPRIEAELKARAQAQAQQAPAGRPSDTRVPRASVGVSPAPWWQRLVLWQGLSGVALAAVVLLGSTLVWREAFPPPAEVRYVAVLQDPNGGGNGWVVEMTKAPDTGGELRLVPLVRQVSVPQDRVLQFWTKAPGAPGPSSLGLVSAGTTTSLPLGQVPGLQPDQLFEITLEPPGGSTVGRPTGPVLYIGRAVRLTS